MFAARFLSFLASSLPTAFVLPASPFGRPLSPLPSPPPSLSPLRLSADFSPFPPDRPLAFRPRSAPPRLFAPAPPSATLPSPRKTSRPRLGTFDRVCGELARSFSARRTSPDRIHGPLESIDRGRRESRSDGARRRSVAIVDTVRATARRMAILGPITRARSGLRNRK